MSKMSLLAAGLIVIASVLILPPASAQEPALAIDPEARETLQRMGSHLQSLKRFEVSGESTSEYRLDNGMLVERATRTKLLVERPDRFRASMIGDDRHQYLYLNRGELTLYTHDGGYYARAEVPKDLGEAMQFALEEFGIEAPLMDLLYEDPATRFVDGVESARYLGKSRVRGVECHQLALRDPGVDVQIWITTGEKPVMRKIVIADRWLTGSPSFSAILDWELAPSIDAKDFVFEPPEGSMEIQFTPAGR
jgi:hypothetical protein